MEQLYDVFEGYNTFYTTEDYGFYSEGIESGQFYKDSMIKLWYYGMTTLSTIGYGDFLPKCVSEKLFISFVMMFGVTVFSYIMSNFIDILNEFKEIEYTGDHRNLTKWMTLLTKFNDQKPLVKDLILRIENHFSYLWLNNPLGAIQTETDLRFI